jgi:hypothetical protein
MVTAINALNSKIAQESVLVPKLLNEISNVK